MRVEKNYRIPLAALGLVSLSLAACEYRWVLDKAQEHGSEPHGPAPGGQPDAPACQDAMLIDDTLCKDPGTFKNEAWEACTAAGLVLTAYTPEKECGNGAYRYVRYTCCKAAPNPPPPPPPGMPDPNSCMTEKQGGDTNCKDAGTWKQYASQACEGNGLLLTGLSLNDPCGEGMARVASYTCCTKDGSALPPSGSSEPPDPFAGTPIPGPSHLAQFKCCASEADCFVVRLGSDAVCQDTAAWTDEATATCAAKERTLYGLGLYGACKP